MRDSFGRRERPRRLGRRLVILVLVLAVGGGIGLILWGGTEGPEATLTQPLRIVGTSTPLRLAINAGPAGLRSIRVVAQRADGTEALLAEEEIARSGLLGSGVRKRAIDVDLDAKRLGLPEGPAQIAVYARDYAPLALLDGDEAILQIPITVDLTAPTARVRGSTHYVTAGGSDLVVYEVDPDTESSAVVVEDIEFPGEHPPGFPPRVRVALYSLAHDASAEVRPRVVVSDAAGNRRAVSFPVVVREKEFPAEDVQISTKFIDGTVRPLLAARDRPEPEEPIAAFLAVNRDLRRDSDAELKRLTAQSEPGFIPRGAFRQQAGTQVGSRFAEERTYFFAGEAIDRQTHLGYDLASVRQAPIHAAQDGVVQAVLDLGIYGNVVVIDHGLGLSSLYAHLSSTQVTAGQRVEASQPVGRSGETGLASGDHLHFSMMVRGHHVDPIEWWDPRWVELHIHTPLAEASGSIAAPDGPTTPTAE